MPRRRIPVVVISGFLGSGKTTLLNHLLRYNAGTRIGVVVNDFGSINIDSMLVAGQVDSTVSLSNGCMCCAVDTDDLDAILAKLADKRSEIDVIVVEASGLSEPRNLIRLVRGSTEDRIEYGGLVTIIDGAEFGTTRTQHPELDQHIRLADLLVLNKVDRITGDQLDLVLQSVRTIAEQTPIIATTHGRVAAELLFDSPGIGNGENSPRQMTLDELLTSPEELPHAHLDYSSAAFSALDPLDPRRFIDFLESPPGNIYRIKGIVYFGISGYRQKFIVHTVGRHITIVSKPWTPGESRGTQLVFIGTDVDQSSIDDAFSAIVVDRAVSDESAMLPVHRYWVRAQPIPTRRG